VPAGDFDIYVSLLAEPPHLRPWEVDALDPDFLDEFVAHQNAKSKIIARERHKKSRG
jgi:hypothetical protein